MGLRIALVGDPTKGKSTGIFPNENLGIKGLNPDETIILTLSGKKLPIRGGDSLYPKGEKLTDGAKLVHVKDTKLLAPMIKLVSDKFPNIKNVVLEDCQYSMSFEFMNRAKETGYNKFTDIGVIFSSWMMEAQDSRDDLNVIVIWHPEKDKDGVYKMKTIGNMIDSYLTPEGLMDIILYADCEKGSDGKMDYYYVTNNDGKFGARSPVGMFDSIHIPNDLGLVTEKINEYYR